MRQVPDPLQSGDGGRAGSSRRRRTGAAASGQQTYSLPVGWVLQGPPQLSSEPAAPPATVAPAPPLGRRTSSEHTQSLRGLGARTPRRVRLVTQNWQARRPRHSSRPFRAQSAPWASAAADGPARQALGLGLHTLGLRPLPAPARPGRGPAAAPPLPPWTLLSGPFSPSLARSPPLLASRPVPPPAHAADTGGAAPSRAHWGAGGGTGFGGAGRGDRRGRGGAGSLRAGRGLRAGAAPQLSRDPAADSQTSEARRRQCAAPAAAAAPPARSPRLWPGWAGGRAGYAGGARRDPPGLGARPAAAPLEGLPGCADAGPAAEPEPEHAGRGAGGWGARGAAVAAAPRPGPWTPTAGRAPGRAAGWRERAVLERPVQLEGEVSPRGATGPGSPRLPSFPGLQAECRRRRPRRGSRTKEPAASRCPGPEDAQGRRACSAAGSVRPGRPLAARQSPLGSPGVSAAGPATPHRRRAGVGPRVARPRPGGARPALRAEREGPLGLAGGSGGLGGLRGALALAASVRVETRGQTPVRWAACGPARAGAPAPAL